MSPLVLSGLLVGAVAAAIPFVFRCSGQTRLKLVAVPLSTVLFATSFTLAGNGPLLRPLLAGVTTAQSAIRLGAVDARDQTRATVATAPVRVSVPTGFGRGFRQPAPLLGGLYGALGTVVEPGGIIALRTLDGRVHVVPGGRHPGPHRLRPARGSF